MLVMDVKTVVPGHGKLGNKETILHMVDYIDSIDKLAQKMINDNIPMENIPEIEMPKPFSSWWFDRFFIPNLSFMYNLHKEKR
jgi:hypothetical protein